MLPMGGRGHGSEGGRYYRPTPPVGRAGTDMALQQPQEPLITDTLTACLDANGTYLCTSYTPRCYIIQKVGGNSVRVSRGGGTGGGPPGFPPKPSAADGSDKREPGSWMGRGERDGGGSSWMSWESGKTVVRGMEDGLIPMPIHIGPHTLVDNPVVNGLGDGRELGQAPHTLHTDQGHRNNNPETTEPPTEELRQLVLTQLEYYFSPDNLSNDKFLVSQMDSDQYVYISTVANFNMIKKLSCDLDLITDVLRKSKQVQVHSDGKRVRPISNRTVVILRGIPETTPIEQIKALFEKESSPRCNKCEFAFNDSWYLSFDSDEDAVRAHRYLREEVREFNGQPIMARIKSRPTTLLSQGVGMNPIKNGYHQPPNSLSLPPFISSPYVPVSQPGPPSSVTTTPLYPPTQVSSVFTLPQSPYVAFGAQLPWTTGFYDMNPVLFNGITPSPQPSPNYGKVPQQMPPRHRPPKSDSESFNGGRGGGPGGGLRRPNSSSESLSVNGTSNGPSSQYGGVSVGRKNGAPAPLLGMAPPPPSNHVPLHSHNHQSHVGSSMGGQSGGGMGRNNGHLHYASLPPHAVPHLHSEQAYHRSYRGDRGGADSRPRSSLGTRRPGRGRDDEGPYDGSSSGMSGGRMPSASRGPPAVSRPLSPQPPPPVIAKSSREGGSSGTNFDLEVSAFPPLPGSANAAAKNEDSPYEGRLSDVVKGVKSLVVRPEKEEAEIVVSAEYGETSAYVVSVASPSREMTKGGDGPSSQPHFVLSPTKKIREFREVGVGFGCPDDNQDIRASASKECVVVGGKEMADKSTQVRQPLTQKVGSGPQAQPPPALIPPKHVAPEKEREAAKKEVGVGEKRTEENCSNDEGADGGPVRLSYAQVAQTRLDKPTPAPAAPPGSASSSTSPNNSGSGSEKGDDKGRRGGVGKEPPRPLPPKPMAPPHSAKPAYTKRGSYNGGGRRERMGGPRPF